MEIDGMHHVAGRRIVQRDFYGISLAHSNHRARNFAVESPVAVGCTRARIQCPNDFPRNEWYVYDSCRAVTDGSWNVGGITSNVSTPDRNTLRTFVALGGGHNRAE